MDTDLAGALDLSDDQVRSIRRLHQSNSIAQRENRSRERRLAVRMLVVMDKSPVNQEALDGLRTKYEEITIKTIRQQVDVVRQLREILTDEQWKIIWEERPAVIQIGRFKPIRPRMIRVTDQPPAEARKPPATDGAS
jgi:Spy/CpxP family protein refolding chaperone